MAFAIPNAGARSFATASYQKAEGLRSGIPDVFIPVPTKNAHGLFLEFKSATGVLSLQQEHYLYGLRKLQYACYVVVTAEEAKKLTLEYLE